MVRRNILLPLIELGKDGGRIKGCSHAEVWITKHFSHMFLWITFEVLSNNKNNLLLGERGSRGKPLAVSWTPLGFQLCLCPPSHSFPPEMPPWLKWLSSAFPLVSPKGPRPRRPCLCCTPWFGTLGKPESLSTVLSLCSADGSPQACGLVQQWS